jgi:hypothetical protein
MKSKISLLVNGGDWACAHADAHGLADVCLELAGVVGMELAPRLQNIADIAEIDMERASWEWLELSGSLRRVPFAPPSAPRSVPMA